MEEIWKEIDGYDGKYFISNLGRVKSFQREKSGKLLALSHDNDGYLLVGLHYAQKGIPDKKAKVHRLVAQAFVPNPNNYPEVNHKDENKENNNANNLEWCTTRYNLTYGHRLDCAKGENNDKHKLTINQVKEIRRLYISKDKEYGLSALARKYDVKHSSIYAIVNRKTWKHLEE